MMMIKSLESSRSRVDSKQTIRSVIEIENYLNFDTLLKMINIQSFAGKSHDRWQCYCDQIFACQIHSLIIFSPNSNFILYLLFSTRHTNN